MQGILSFTAANGLPRPELDYEVIDPITGETLTTVDLAWPKGIQEEYSQPIALVLEASKDVITILNQVDYRFFTSIKALYQYLENQVDGNTKQFIRLVEGAHDFVTAINRAQEDLVKLSTYHGKSGMLTLLPRLTANGGGLVTIYNKNGKASLQFWRSVFKHHAPKSLIRVEELVGEIGQGTFSYEFGDKLLNALTLAYMEAAGRDIRGISG